MSASYEIGVEGLKLIHEGLSDVGCRRSRNEDTIGFFPPSDRAGTYLAVIADGVGGTNAGDVASQLAVKTIGDGFFAGPAGETTGEALYRCLQAANDAIVDQAAGDPALEGMATTCTCAAVQGNTLVIGHLGDCRAYMCAGGSLIQLTNDHSLADEYAQEGREIPPDQIHLTNVLTRWLGVPGPVPAEISPVTQFDDENTLVMCSDGLIKVVGDDEILHAVAMHLPGTACQKLVQLARERGGPDNISLHVIRLTRY